MPADERPRERLRMYGPETLTNAELIAILLRTGINGENAVAVGQRLLSTYEGLRGLSKAAYGQLARQRAMGDAKACQLMAAMELGKRVAKERLPERRVIRSPEDVYAMLFSEMALLEEEHLRVVLLSVRQEVLATREVYRGNVSSIGVHPGVVFKEAVREGCPGMIVVHNHPSGDPSPSGEDVDMTRQLIESGKLLGVELTDHVIIARHGHASLRETRKDLCWQRT
jgi:DNA repair protein RadC